MEELLFVMNAKLRQQAIDLRLKHSLSYTAIRKQLGVSKSTLSYWLKEYPLDADQILELRREGWQKGEASRERFRNTMRAKQEMRAHEIYRAQKARLATLSSEAWFTAGLMLYAAEGDKKQTGRIALANTDPQIIKFFIEWLDTFLDIPKSRIKAQLHLYENMDIDKEREFWKNELALEDNHLYKVQIRKLKSGSFTYEGSNRHGTCSIFISGVGKKQELMMGIKALLDEAKVKYMRV